MKFQFPPKPDREKWEIEGFIRHYRLLPGSRQFEIVGKGERPDWRVRDSTTGEVFGVELTSVYLDDRSVPEVHQDSGIHKISAGIEEFKKYAERISKAVRKKVLLARDGYNSAEPLILSIYLNEYLTILATGEKWVELLRVHEETFDDIAPFIEIVLWPLSRNDEILSVKPTEKAGGETLGN